MKQDEDPATTIIDIGTPDSVVNTTATTVETSNSFMSDDFPITGGQIVALAIVLAVLLLAYLFIRRDFRKATR